MIKRKDELVCSSGEVVTTFDEYFKTKHWNNAVDLNNQYQNNILERLEGMTNEELSKVIDYIDTIKEKSIDC